MCPSHSAELFWNAVSLSNFPRALRSTRWVIRQVACLASSPASLRFRSLLENAAPYIGHLAQPGTWFGEGPAFTEQPRQVGLAVTRDAYVLHLPLPAIREIVARDPGAWRWLGLALLANLDTAIGGSDDLMIRDHVKRFVAVLLRLGGCRYATPPAGETIEIDVNQEDLAAMTIMARTTAGALLHKLQTAGHIEARYRSIRVLAPDALRAMLAE